MGKIPLALGCMALCLMSMAAPARAVPLRVTPTGRVPPERFYAIPVSRVRGLSGDGLRAKITCCRWGPWTFRERPNTQPGQWYIYPVCRRDLILSETQVGPDVDSIPLTCP